MSIVVKVAARAEREDQQQQLDQDLEEAGIVRIMSAIPPFMLVAADDLKALTSIAATYRCKPRVALADAEDVSDAGESEATTDELVDFVHHLGYTFNWDDDERLWCVSGLRDGFPDETPDEPAPTRRVAAIEAIRFLASA